MNPNHLESRKVEVTQPSFGIVGGYSPVQPSAYLPAVICDTIASKVPFLMAITPLGSMR